MTFELVSIILLVLTLFVIGICGIIYNRKNLLILLMSIELTLLAINLGLILFSNVIDDLGGQIFSLYVLTVAAAESAIGLAILVVYYRIRGTVSISFINLLKG